MATGTTALLIGVIVHSYGVYNYENYPSGTKYDQIVMYSSMKDAGGYLAIASGIVAGAAVIPFIVSLVIHPVIREKIKKKGISFNFGLTNKNINFCASIRL